MGECHICEDACGVQKSASYPLGFGSWAVISCLTWMLGTELGSSAKVANTLLLVLPMISPDSSLLQLIFIMMAHF